MIDLVVSIGLLALIALAGSAYAASSFLRKGGRKHFDRVDKEGASVLLGRSSMEVAHFSLEPIGRMAVAIGLTANGITLVSLILGAAAGVALGLGHFGIAAGLSTVSALCDTLDGMVARLTKTASDAGEVFDAAVDRYNEFFFLAGLAYYFREDELVLALVMAALLGSFMVSYATAKAEALQVKPPRGAMRRAERATYLTLGVGLVPIAARFGPVTVTPIAGPPATVLGAGISLVAAAPTLFALLLVAVVGNISAARRLHAVASLVAARDRTLGDAAAKLAAAAAPGELEAAEHS